ncbi:MAG: cytochrome c [Saprospiraceae bacterium]|jgi:cytochrome c
MKYFALLFKGLVLLLLTVGIFSCENQKDATVLVFSKTAGYRHQSIEPGIDAIKKLGSENGFLVKTTEDASAFKEENLKRYAAVIFLNTTGDVLDHVQQADFERYIQAGGGFVGIHAAADTEYDWIWYGKLVGGYFNGHPSDPNVRHAKIKVLDKNHICSKVLPDTWEREDEWYNYKNLNPNTNVIATLDETSYEGGTNGENHPISWYHDFDGGRAFYTGCGHTEASYSEPLYLQHLLGGIQYAIGNNNLDYSKTTFHQVPPENRFVKTVLAQNLDEPMELDILDNGKILFVERKGAIKLYDPETEILRLVTEFPVHTKFEDGLLGMTIDPNYKENKWLYLFYSPVGKKPVQHVSRFVFDNDSLHYATEKVVIEIPVQRDECCHSGGSLEFGADGNLYIGVGDDTNPFDSDGFAPIDERKGRSAWDAQRSSGNTNDLRGAILRITPQSDGTYTIPKGNLFPEGTAKTKPEIYVKGCRNPFRISIDSKTNYLYWGDVGPDSGKDGDLRGPKGLDEFNQARTAGYWGWPYFRGNNQQYFDYNFVKERSGEKFNPEKPINDSPNNTGLTELPPSNKSMIWYSYDKSQEFPWIGVGGKNPMAGPIYYSDEYESNEKFPEYFDGKLIAYEWMRHWMYLIKFDSTGNMIKIDPFMQNTEFSRPMDMIFGKDGKLYMLEYGNKWFAKNLDARLTRIDYIRGNRTPVAAITAAKTVGGAPLTLILSAEKSYDFDEDKLSYEWNFGDGTEKNITGFPRHTFEKPGIYTVSLTVTDSDGQQSTAKQEIHVGNEPPELNWELAGNQSFYWDNRNLSYQVNVNDAEDGNTEDGSLSAENIIVSFDYLAQGFDVTEIAQGHQMEVSTSDPLGKRLIDGSDCKSCHALNEKINGPSYIEIAARYRKDENAFKFLAGKIIKGGGGNWGETAMAAHPQLSEGEATEIAKYILAVNGEVRVDSKYPASGNFVAKDHIKEEEKGQYILMASYTDKGNESIKPITSRKQINLRSSKIEAGHFDEASKDIIAGGDDARELYNNSFLVYKNLDYTDIESISFAYGMRDGQETGGTIEVHLDNKEGEPIEKIEIEKPGESDINLSGIEGFHDLYLIFKKPNNDGKQIVVMDWIRFNPSKTLTLK